MKLFFVVFFCLVLLACSHVTSSQKVKAKWCFLCWEVEGEAESTHEGSDLPKEILKRIVPKHDSKPAS